MQCRILFHCRNNMFMLLCMYTHNNEASSLMWFLFSLVIVIIMQVPESQSHSYYLPLLSTQINFQCVDPFQVLHLCSNLGLPLLQSYTLHHIASSLTSESVSRVLLTSESLLESCEDDMLKVALQRVHLDCIAFIQTHTRTVFLSESFLLLPKDTLITIISDNKVGIIIYRKNIIVFMHI